MRVDTLLKLLLSAFCILSVIQQNSALADDNAGLSYLGICHKDWPCELGLNAYEDKDNLKLSFLYDETFGSDCSCIRAMYKDPRPKLTRIHLSNGPGLRNNRLQKEEIFYGYNIHSAQTAILKNDPVLKQKFEQVAQRAANDYKQSVGTNQLYVSTCLECNFSAKARQQLNEWAKPFFPSAQFVDNPLIDTCIAGLVCEKHGATPILTPPCSVDLDGKDAQSVNIPAYKERYKSCIAAYIWGYQFNLVDSKVKHFIPPRERTKIPDQDYFNIFKEYLD